MFFFKELDKLEMTATADHKFQINIYRLDIFNNVFEQIIMDSKLFGATLNKIKVIKVFIEVIDFYTLKL